MGAVLTVLILALSTLTVSYFNEPRSFAVIIALALRPFIKGFENVGVIAFQKELNFRKDFKFGVISKISSFFLTITAAFILRNHWALVIGVLGGGVFATSFSYFIHPFRPRFCFTRIRELLSFSVHILSQSIMLFLIRRLDEFIVGGVAGTLKMGLYHVAADVGAAPTDELVGPISRPLNSIYAKLKDDAASLRETYLSTLSMISTLALSAGTGVTFVAQELVDVVLGEKWHAVGGIIIWLSLAAAALAIADTAANLMNPIGKELLATRLRVVQTLLLLPCLSLAGLYGTVVDIAAARFAISAIMVPICLIGVGRVLNVGARDYARVIWRPALGAGVMAVVLTWLDRWLDVPVAWDLVISVVVGGVAFISVVSVAWLSTGRPKGFETTAVELVLTFWSRLVRRRPQAV